MKKSILIFIIFSLVTIMFGKEPVPKGLLSLLKSSTTDQIMMALEPEMKMEQEEFEKIWRVTEGANTNSFILQVCASDEKNAKPNERFYASYITSIALIPFFFTPHSYIQPMYDIIGKGPTPHAALVDMVVQLVEKKIIDPKRLRERLARF
ncbi:MAG: hypothetical protein PVH61_14000 [Candidatus Aminicenantes bacterium]